MSGDEPRDAGELNFALTTIVDKYLQNRGGLRYAHINEVVGALECAKLELYRRVAAPYEDQKDEGIGRCLSLRYVTSSSRVTLLRQGFVRREPNYPCLLKRWMVES